MIKRVLSFLVGAALFAGIGVLFAVFVIPDYDEVPSNTITSDTAATIDMTMLPTSAVWTGSLVEPGEIVTGMLTITNNSGIGGIVADITATLTGDAALADALRVNMNKSSCANGPFLDSDGGSLNTPEFSGTLSDLVAAAPITSNTYGPTDAAEYCFSLVLPISGASGFGAIAGLSTDVTIIVDSDVP